MKEFFSHTLACILPEHIINDIFYDDWIFWVFQQSNDLTLMKPQFVSRKHCVTYISPLLMYHHLEVDSAALMANFAFESPTFYFKALTFCLPPIASAFIGLLNAFFLLSSKGMICLEASKVNNMSFIFSVDICKLEFYVY